MKYLKTFKQLNELHQDTYRDAYKKIHQSRDYQRAIDFRKSYEDIKKDEFGNDMITIHAIDTNSSESMTRVFTIKDPELFKYDVDEWEKNIDYYRYYLIADEWVEDFSEEIQDILDELEIEN